MKYCSFILVFCLLAVSPAMAQKKLLRKFYREEKRAVNGVSFRIGLGRATLKFASWVIPASVMKEDGVPLKRLLGKVTRLKLYTITGDTGYADASTGPIQRLKAKLIEQEHFETLMEVRDKGSIVHILNKGNEDDLGNLVLLVQDERDFVILHLRTHLQMQDVNQLVQAFAKN